MGGSGGGPSSSYSSSGEEDGDADWKAAIDSVATTSISINSSSLTNGGFTTISNHSTPNFEENQRIKQKPQTLKHYQIKAQKILDDILEKTLVMVRDPLNDVDNDTKINESGVRLFKHAPPGIVFDHIDELQGPRKRPRIVPGKEFDEKSKKFRRQLQSVAVDGYVVMATARDACQKSLARLQAKDAAAKAAAKREEERVAELKRIRGERWLPSIAREMQMKFKS
ncbi:hypothetical protein L1049_024058 [Liquidambar formosana]|uniref:Uncharacterized protein n=1 Tax=Liquidambar formosana TaxID=63359 RepID=A0AAP0RVC6_LIQFO